MNRPERRTIGLTVAAAVIMFATILIVLQVAMFMGDVQ